jgi:hypothetical protein
MFPAAAANRSFAKPSLACGGSGVPTAWVTVGGVLAIAERTLPRRAARPAGARGSARPAASIANITRNFNTNPPLDTAAPRILRRKLPSRTGGAARPRAYYMYSVVRLLSHAITLEVVVSSGRYTSTWALKLEA